RANRGRRHRRRYLASVGCPERPGATQALLATPFDAGFLFLSGRESVRPRWRQQPTCSTAVGYGHRQADRSLSRARWPGILGFLLARWPDGRNFVLVPRRPRGAALGSPIGPTAAVV